MKKSLHILADLYDCQGEQKYFTNKTVVRDRILRTVKKAGFQIVASRFHKFGNGGITGVLIVSESHITVHTWPEKTFVNVDVFFCNYNSDNSKKARMVFNSFKQLYKPKKIHKKEVWRD